jgi:hypothetical protein
LCSFSTLNLFKQVYNYRNLIHKQMIVVYKNQHVQTKLNSVQYQVVLLPSSFLPPSCFASQVVTTAIPPHVGATLPSAKLLLEGNIIRTK